MGMSRRVAGTKRVSDGGTPSARAVPAVNAEASTTSLELRARPRRETARFDPALAAQQATEILRVVGEHPRALRLLAVMHAAAGDDQAAVGIPARWRAPAGLGAGASGFLAARWPGSGADEAVAALRRATALQPEALGAWLALADALGANGDAAGADAAYLRHVRQSAKDRRCWRLARRCSKTARRKPKNNCAFDRAHAERCRRDPHAGRTSRAPRAATTRRWNCSRVASSSRRDSTPRARTWRRCSIAATGRTEALQEVETLLAAEPATRVTRTSRR